MKHVRTLALFLFLFFATFTFAQDTKFVSLSGIDPSKADLAPFMTKAFEANASIGDLVNAMFRAAIGVGAILAVLQLARAGFYYMGSDLWHKKEQAKSLMTDAVIGLIVLLAVWLVLNQINPQLLNLNVLSGVKNIQSTSQPASTPPTPFSPVDTGGLQMVPTPPSESTFIVAP